MQERSDSQIVIVAAHAGGAKRARRIARKLGMQFAMVDKRRLSGTNEYQAMNIVGDITPTAVIVDDMIGNFAFKTVLIPILRHRNKYFEGSRGNQIKWGSKYLCLRNSW